MFTKTLFVCFFLTLHNEDLSLSCRWMDHKFRQFSKSSLDLLDMMPMDQLGFIVQTLEEIIDLFNEDLDHVTWEESRLDNFLNVLSQQMDGMRSCIVTQKKKSKKLHMYFKRLSRQVLERMDHSAEAWEQIRKEIRKHLCRVDLLVSATLNNN
ncbi:interferon phi 4 [Polymixia lowei]